MLAFVADEILFCFVVVRGGTVHCVWVLRACAATTLFVCLQAVQIGSVVEEKITIEQSNVSQYISSSTFAASGISFANADLLANVVTLYADGLDTNCSVAVTAASRTSLSFSLESGLFLSDCSFVAGSAIGISVGLLNASSPSSRLLVRVLLTSSWSSLHVLARSFAREVGF